MDCIFCQIVAGELPAERLYEDDDTLAFPDLRPRAPHHLLVIPKRHVDSLASTNDDDWAVVAACLHTVQRVARDRGLDTAGYRVVSNIGSDGGQTVNHLHWHVLGGRLMTWPPG
ncbi:MAG: histidine triad nucleotide-binding protein [Thermaerobacter sp.]|nr:histidine triad nucleotide-binding protein [Thermaerobacter sp.]